MSGNKETLAARLRGIVDTATFVTASATDKLEPDSIREVGQRAGWPLSQEEDDTEWYGRMVQATTPLRIPSWLPMPEVIKANTLIGGARGMRSLFTSKPSEKQLKTTRHLAGACTRMITSVMATKGELSPVDHRWRASFVAAFGLPEPEQESILSEPIRVISHVESLPEQLSGKTAVAAVNGLWFTAFRGGLDPAQDDLVVSLAQAMEVDASKIEQGRQWAKQLIPLMKQPTAATVDAIRYVLSDAIELATPLARHLAKLALPPCYLDETLASIEHGGPIVLAQRHELSKQQRSVCLGISWLAALRSDPTVTRCATLAERHDRIAEDLGNQSEGASTRRVVRQMVENLLQQPLEPAE